MYFPTLALALTLLASTVVLAAPAPAWTSKNSGKSSDLTVTSFVDVACGKHMIDDDGAPIYGNPVVHTWGNMIYAANSLSHDVNAVFKSLLLSRALRPGEQLDVNTMGADKGFVPNVDGPPQCGHNVQKVQYQAGMSLCQSIHVGGMCARLVQY